MTVTSLQPSSYVTIESGFLAHACAYRNISHNFCVPNNVGFQNHPPNICTWLAASLWSRLVFTREVLPGSLSSDWRTI